MRVRFYDVLKSILFGNFLYGICAVTLAIESSVQLSLPLHSFFFYLFVFSTTKYYYTYAYISCANQSNCSDMRLIWYQKFKGLVQKSQQIHASISFLVILLLINPLNFSAIHIPIVGLIALCLFLGISILYYGSVRFRNKKWQFRKYGLFKPLIIGFIWAGMVSFLPIFFYDLASRSHFTFSLLNSLQFLSNWIFISLLAVIFDIKDYAQDANQHISTWVVKLGLSNTIFKFLLPITIISLILYCTAAYQLNFTAQKIVFNSIPWILLIIVSYSMHQRKSILYYLAIIDGLMLIKSSCGILGII